MPARSAAPARRTRTLKSPRQRAEETLRTTEKRKDTLAVKLAESRLGLAALEKEYEAAVRRYQHAEANPDLHDELDDPLPMGGES